MAFLAHALARLKASGFRLTRTRRMVISVLDEAQASLSPYEIRDRIREAGEPIDTVSVYRILECLEGTGLAHRVLSSGKFVRCAIEDEESCPLPQLDHCHHPMVCRRCGRVEELHCPDLGTWLSTVTTGQGFRIENHQLELGGMCGRCAA